MLRIGISDLVSPSYFVATAAVELGFLKEQGYEAEIVPMHGGWKELRDGGVQFMAGSPYPALQVFPNWDGAKILCALSQHTYWFLSVRSDLHASRGDLAITRGLKLGASDGPGMGLRRLLMDGGIDVERDNVRIEPMPLHFADGPDVRSQLGVNAIKHGDFDGFWGNGMRVEIGVREGVADVLVDVRRGDGPPGSMDYTFPALTTSDRMIAEQPAAVEAAVRAVVNVQEALRADASLATEAARKHFPPAELELIPELIRRDTPFYEAAVSEFKAAKLNEFAWSMGLAGGPVAYDQVVAGQIRHLWTR